MGSSKLELNEDEVTIIRGVLDLRDKSPANIMTPLEDVFMLEESAILDEAMLSNVRDLFWMLAILKDCRSRTQPHPSVSRESRVYSRDDPCQAAHHSRSKASHKGWGYRSTPATNNSNQHKSL